MLDIVRAEFVAGYRRERADILTDMLLALNNNQDA